MKVAQIMKQGVQSCRGEDGLNRAAQIMWEHDCGCVPVVDADGAVVGIITDRDVCMAAYTRGGPLSALRVREAMSKTVFACRPEDTVAAAEKMMRDKQIRRLPVVDGANHLVGIVSLNDLACEAAREKGLRKKEISFAEVGETIEAVCRPRASAVAVVH